jgi:hypothetical protein
MRACFGIPISIEEPTWVRKLKLPGQAEIESQISGRRGEIQKMQTDIVLEEARLALRKRRYRLLYDDGESLEEAVKEGFECLGASVNKRSIEKEDYRLNFGNLPEAVLEVKGTHNEKFTKGALRQLAGWMDEVNAAESKLVKGIFIGNAARNDEPTTRPKVIFEANCEDYGRATFFL